jgi:hypothetical protein
MSTRVSIYRLKVLDASGKKIFSALLLLQSRVGRHLFPEEVIKRITAANIQNFKGYKFDLAQTNDGEIIYFADDFELTRKCPEHGEMGPYPFCGKCGKPTLIVPK